MKESTIEHSACTRLTRRRRRGRVERQTLSFYAICLLAATRGAFFKMGVELVLAEMIERTMTGGCLVAVDLFFVLGPAAKSNTKSRACRTQLIACAPFTKGKMRNIPAALAGAAVACAGKHSNVHANAWHCNSRIHSTSHKSMLATQHIYFSLAVVRKWWHRILSMMIALFISIASPSICFASPGCCIPSFLGGNPTEVDSSGKASNIAHLVDTESEHSVRHIDISALVPFAPSTLCQLDAIITTSKTQLTPVLITGKRRWDAR